MSDTVMVSGRVASEPSMKVLESGVRITSFRLATSHRYVDRETGQWTGSHPNFYGVACFNDLAAHAAGCIKKGQPVLVMGRLKVREYVRGDGTRGTGVDIEAAHLGHDLRFGLASFTALKAPQPESADSQAGAQVPFGSAPVAGTASEGFAEGGAAEWGAASSSPAAGFGVPLEGGFAEPEGEGRKAEEEGVDPDTGELEEDAA